MSILNLSEETVPRTDLLKPLDHLSYLLECAALDCMGELKSELSKLCTSITEGRPGYEAPEVKASLPQLEEASILFRSNNLPNSTKKAQGASILSSVSRYWWTAAKP
jgi:hypothetical protein